MGDINGDQNVNEEIFNTHKPGVELLMEMIELDIDRVWVFFDGWTKAAKNKLSIINKYKVIRVTEVWNACKAEEVWLARIVLTNII